MLAVYAYQTIWVPDSGSGAIRSLPSDSHKFMVELVFLGATAWKGCIWNWLAVNSFFARQIDFMTN